MAERTPGWLRRHFWLYLALRYLKARRKQAFTSVVTVVSVLGVTVGVAALIIALALLTGFQEDIQGKIIGANAHVFVQPYAPALEGAATIVAVAESIPGVVAAAPAVLLPGMIIGRSAESAFVNLKGIDARAEARTTQLLEVLIEGSAEDLVSGARGIDGRPWIVLGVDLATELFVRVGEQVKIMIYDTKQVNPFGGGGLRFQTFDVVGVFRAGMYEYDRTWALIPLQEAQRLLRLGDSVSLVQVRVDDIFATRPIVKVLGERLGSGYFITDWQQMNRAYFAALQLEKLALFVVISLIVGVAALNIVATLVLMIKDKQHDIGILMSLGARRRDILRIFIALGLVIGLAGTLAGCALGVGAAVLLDHYQVVRLEAQVYYLSYVPFHVRWYDFSRVALFAVLVSYAATLYPAWRASRLDPVIALRYE